MVLPPKPLIDEMLLLRSSDVGIARKKPLLCQTLLQGPDGSS